MTVQLAERPGTQAETPRIYLACLAAYNAGRLHGAWVDVPKDVEDLLEAIRQVLGTSPEPDAEEWCIHDFEGFGSIRLSEYASLERVIAMADLIREHGATGSALVDHFGGEVEAARKSMEEDYQGCFPTLEAYAEQFMEYTGSLQDVPQYLHAYIDYERLANDWEMNGDIFTIELGYNDIHVFWNR